MTITVENLVSREVHYCVSFLVSTLAGGMSCSIHSEGRAREERTNLAEAVEQAFELACPIDDYEEAAFQAGWTQRGNIAFLRAGDSYDLNATTWQNICEERDIEPYQREVYEHWIVSDWLADRLAEKGEKVDKDFAGLTVWARTTTGQGIASDSVIEAIHAALVGEA